MARAWVGVRSAFCVLIAGLVLAGAVAPDALALEPVVLDPGVERQEITFLGQQIDGRGDRLQVETAAGADGLAPRMVVRAATPGTDPWWTVFALRNPTDKPIERWLVAARYNIVGSRFVLPDLDARRIERVTPSIGFVPERVANDRADIFRLTVDPGQTVTFVAELSVDSYPRIYLWSPVVLQSKQRNSMLFNGIMLGIVGLLAIFLTAIFAANHKAIFPAAALVVWSALAYLCIDFGFWHKLFQVSPEDNAFYRAVAEASLAAGFVVFLYTFLRVKLWHGWIRMFFGVWILGQFGIVIMAFLDPVFAASFARASFGVIGAVGSLPILYLALRGQDRALSLMPTWLLVLVWFFGMGAAITGNLNGDVVVPGLTAGFVLIQLLLGFTVTQFAFRTVEPSYGDAPGLMHLRSLAVDGAGSCVWEWNSRRDEISVGARIEEVLGLDAGTLSGSVENWINYLHAGDRERFRLVLWSVQEKNDGHIHSEFRMRRADNSYRWFELEAAAVVNMESRSPRCVGLLRDVTESKRSQDRLIHDAVHDSLTGLPSRELFVDRLSVALGAARNDPAVRPTVLFIDIDRFKNVNNAFGLIVGDSMLLTMARRLGRHLSEQDTLARVGGDQFAVLLSRQHKGSEVAMAAERVRRSLRSPMKIAGKEIILTGSIGIAVFDGQQETAQDLLREAEIAMYRAKRGGTDRIELFKAEMRSEREERVALESDLRRAISRDQIHIYYQPIVRLSTSELAGFEALIRWNHPQFGQLEPDEFMPIAEDSDLINALGAHVLQQAVQDAAVWQKRLPRTVDPLFVSVNISSRELLRPSLAQEVRAILRQELISDGSLRLEVTESLVMENPERAVEILSWLKEAGAGLSLDDYGTGYSSLSDLQRLPFDTIKIDRSLVQDEGSDDRSDSIVRSVIALAHELGREVVAEGVETAERAGRLREFGCEQAQGYFFGTPMTQREVLDILKIVRKSERNPEKKGLFASWFSRSGGGTGGAASEGVPSGSGKDDEPSGARNVNGAGGDGATGDARPHTRAPAQNGQQGTPARQGAASGGPAQRTPGVPPSGQQATPASGARAPERRANGAAPSGQNGAGPGEAAGQRNAGGNPTDNKSGEHIDPPTTPVRSRMRTPRRGRGSGSGKDKN